MFRWGIMSTAKIGREQVIPAIQDAENGVITAIASRDEAKARAVADRFGVPHAFGSYDAMLASDTIDGVYIPLTTDAHVEWSLKAAKAGKHVLCEKPIGLSVEEAETLQAAGERFPQLKLMEAFMYRHHPQWTTAKRIVEDGGVGELRTIQSFFSYFNDNPQNIRNQPEIGGGGLMDIGCYPISWSRWMFGEEPARVLGHLEIDPQLGVDRIASGVLEFSRGTGTFTCSTQFAPYQRANIIGTTGRVEIEIPANAPPDKPCRLWHQSQKGIREILCGVSDQYTVQGDLFARAILEDLPVPTPFADAVSNMRVIEAIVRSHEQRGWSTL